MSEFYKEYFKDVNDKLDNMTDEEFVKFIDDTIEEVKTMKEINFSYSSFNLPEFLEEISVSELDKNRWSALCNIQQQVFSSLGVNLGNKQNTDRNK